MKTFKELSIIDPIFIVYGLGDEYKSISITTIKPDSVRAYDYSIEGEDLDKTRIEKRGSFYNNSVVHLFTYEPDAIRYCKANLLRSLREKISAARVAFNSVKEFRKKHYDQLNKDYLDIEINKLENQLRNL